MPNFQNLKHYQIENKIQRSKVIAEEFHHFIEALKLKMLGQFCYGA